MGELQRVSAAAQGLESFPAAVPLYYGLLTALGVAGNALGAAAATLPRQPLSALQQQAWEAQNFGTPWLNPGKTPGQQFTTEGLHAPRRVSNDSTRSEEPPRRIPRRDAASLRAELDATVVAEKDAVAREDFELVCHTRGGLPRGCTLADAYAPHASGGVAEEEAHAAGARALRHGRRAASARGFARAAGGARLRHRLFAEA